MKLLVVTPYFYPKIGGMENYAYNICCGLREKYNWEIVVITSNHIENRYVVEDINGIKVHRLVSLLKISNTPINPLWILQIRQIINQEKPDVINVHSPVVFIADITALLSGTIPLITTYHSGSMLKTKNNLINPFIRFYEKYILTKLFSKSNAIVSYSPDFINNQLQKYQSKTHFITPGVDVNIFKPANVRRDNDLLFVGRIEKNSDWKGVNYLLDAVSIIQKSIPSIRLRLVGSGDQVNYYKKYVKRLLINKNVKFVGSKVGADLVVEYQKSKLFVLPSITESESFGIVLIEAMACATPVVGSDVGGIPYVVGRDNSYGKVVPAANSNALAKTIIELLNDKDRLKVMGKTAVQKVKTGFTWNQKIQETNKLFLSLLK